MAFRVGSIGCLVSLLFIGCGEPPVDSSSSRAPAAQTDPRLLVEGSTGTALVNIPGLGPQKVQYFVKHGLAIHSGDVALTPQELSGLADPRTTAAGRRYEPFKWPDASIPYEIDAASIPPTSQQFLEVLTAMSAYSTNTVIKWVQHQVGSGGDFLRFVADLPILKGGVSDGIGKVGTGQQLIHLAPDANASVISHEIGHALGLYHEQQRADRNGFVKVYDGTNGLPDNVGVCLGAGARSSYLRYSDVSPGIFGNDGVDLKPSFDFSSVMLYGGSPTGCCATGSPAGCCNLPCMTDLNGNGFPANSSLSAQDIDAVNRIYLRFTTNDTLAQAGDVRTIAVASWGPQRLDLLGLRSTDDHLMHAFNNGSGWSSFTEDWGGGLSFTSHGGLQVVSWGVNRLDWVSIGSNDTVTHGWYDGSIHWESLGGGPAIGVTISSQGANKLDIFAVKTDRKIYKRSWNAGWSGWSQISSTGGFSGYLDAVSWGPGRIDIVATTNGNPVQIKQLWWTTGNPWNVAAFGITGVAQKPVTISSWGPNRLDIIYNDGTAAKRISFEGGWGSPMPVVPNNGIVGDSVAQVLTNETVIDFVHFNNVSHQYERATARR